jgi:hypothetical protein
MEDVEQQPMIRFDGAQAGEDLVVHGEMPVNAVA